MTLKSPASGVSHWSSREMSAKVGLSHSTVHRIWQAHALKPHRVETFKFSNDPKAEEKIYDVVGLYMNPPTNAVVLSVDEKTQIQALGRTQPMLPVRPGLSARQTHANPFAVVPLTQLRLLSDTSRTTFNTGMTTLHLSFGPRIQRPLSRRPCDALVNMTFRTEH